MRAAKMRVFKGIKNTFERAVGKKKKGKGAHVLYQKFKDEDSAVDDVEQNVNIIIKKTKWQRLENFLRKAKEAKGKQVPIAEKTPVSSEQNEKEKKAFPAKNTHDDAHMRQALWMTVMEKCSSEMVPTLESAPASPSPKDKVNFAANAKSIDDDANAHEEHSLEISKEYFADVSFDVGRKNHKISQQKLKLRKIKNTLRSSLSVDIPKHSILADISRKGNSGTRKKRKSAAEFGEFERSVKKPKLSTYEYKENGLVCEGKGGKTLPPQMNMESEEKTSSSLLSESASESSPCQDDSKNNMEETIERVSSQKNELQKCEEINEHPRPKDNEVTNFNQEEEPDYDFEGNFIAVIPIPREIIDYILRHVLYLKGILWAYISQIFNYAKSEQSKMQDHMIHAINKNIGKEKKMTEHNFKKERKLAEGIEKCQSAIKNEITREFTQLNSRNKGGSENTGTLEKDKISIKAFLPREKPNNVKKK